MPGGPRIGEIRLEAVCGSAGELNAVARRRTAHSDNPRDEGRWQTERSAEIDDEVVVGFLNGDPGAPIVLGSLQSSLRKAPYVPEQTNAKKAIVTKNQLKLIFDDEKKTICIETPGAHSFLMSDQDKSITVKDTTGNKILLDQSGITMSSPGNVTISAKGSVHISGDAGISVESPANVAISGQNTSVKGDMSLSAQGQLQAEFKSGGQVTIQGLMVMIN